MTVETLKQFTQELAKKVTFNTENLYQHNIMIRFNDGNRKACVSIINNDAIDYTNAVSRFTEYMKKTHSTDNAGATGNLKNLLLCDGYYRNASGVWYQPKFLYYSTDDNAVRVLGLKNTTSSTYVNPNGLEVLSEYGTTFTVNDYVTTVALNNVNKPSYKTVSTKLSLGGTAESAANVKWTCYKYPLGDGKFKYEWVGNYNQTKEVAVTSGYGSGFMSPKFSIALPDSNMVGKCILYAGQSGSTCWVAPSVGGSSLDFYLLRNTSNTRNDTLEINITCSYVGN